MIDKKTEENLDHFLKTNKPVAPSAPPHEKEQILRTITNLHAKQTRSIKERLQTSLKWLVPAAATAVLAIFIITKIPTPTPTTASNVDEYLEDVFGVIYQPNGDMPGDDYFYLGESITRSES